MCGKNVRESERERFSQRLDMATASRNRIHNCAIVRRDEISPRSSISLRGWVRKGNFSFLISFVRCFFVKKRILGDDRESEAFAEIERAFAEPKFGRESRIPSHQRRWRGGRRKKNQQKKRNVDVEFESVNLIIMTHLLSLKP